MGEGGSPGGGGSVDGARAGPRHRGAPGAVTSRGCTVLRPHAQHRGRVASAPLRAVPVVASCSPCAWRSGRARGRPGGGGSGSTTVGGLGATLDTAATQCTLLAVVDHPGEDVVAAVLSVHNISGSPASFQMLGVVALMSDSEGDRTAPTPIPTSSWASAAVPDSPRPWRRARPGPGASTSRSRRHHAGPPGAARASHLALERGEVRAGGGRGEHHGGRNGHGDRNGDRHRDGNRDRDGNRHRDRDGNRDRHRDGHGSGPAPKHHPRHHVKKPKKPKVKKPKKPKKPKVKKKL